MKKQTISFTIRYSATQGDTHAFDMIVLLHKKQIYNYIHTMISNSDDCLDITQDTFLKAYTHIASYDPTRSLSTWLHTIAKYTTYDWLRKKRVHKELSILDDPTTTYTPISPIGNEKDQRIRAINTIDIERSLHTIRPSHARVLHLFYWDGYSYIQIAKIMKKPINTIKTLLYRAKKEVKKNI